MSWPAIGDGKAALDAAATTKPDLIVSDIILTGIGSIQIARELKQRGSLAKVLFLSAREGENCISEALAVGASGYVLKRSMPSDLVLGLNLALAGRYFISPHAFVGAQEHVYIPAIF